MVLHSEKEETNIPLPPKPLIALAGNIGVGKSTATHILATLFGFDVFYEPVVTNRFLEAYYSDMPRWSFTLQLEFLLRRVEHQLAAESSERGCLQDRSLIEDPEIFAKYLSASGFITENELALYDDYFNTLTRHLKQPDAILLLTADTDVLLRRIAHRGRAAERSIDRNFLDGLNELYASFAERASAKYGIPVFTVDVGTIDIRRGPGRRYFVEQVRTRFGI
jgi:deoxyadenosine/deoxycytidine kinase